MHVFNSYSMNLLESLENTLKTMKEQNYEDHKKFRQSLEMLKFFYASKTMNYSNTQMEKNEPEKINLN
jgi:hypothetical protein